MKMGKFTFGESMYRGPMPRFKYLGLLDKVVVLIMLIPSAILMGFIEYALWWEREIYLEDEDATKANRV